MCSAQPALFANSCKLRPYFYNVHVCFAGTLPAAYSQMSLTNINLYSNNLTGDLLHSHKDKHEASRSWSYMMLL